MLVDLVQVQTRDGIRLDGMLQVPETQPTDGIAGFCLVHGTGGNFYSSTLFDALASRLLQRGCAVLRVNTRGHDLMSTAVTAHGGVRIGAAYEIVDDCRHDLAAWIGWLEQRCGPRVGLLGHSLGAVKCLHALASEPAVKPACVIAVSPPRLSYSWFCSSSRAGEFLETYRQADKLVSAGQPTALLDVKFPLPFVITAAGYLEKYGPDERYNYLSFLRQSVCPVLLTLGSVEMATNVAFQGVQEVIEQTGAPPPRVQIEVIDGADHFYSGVREKLADCIDAWLANLPGP